MSAGSEIDGTRQVVYITSPSLSHARENGAKYHTKRACRPALIRQGRAISIEDAEAHDLEQCYHCQHREGRTKGAFHDS